MRRLVLFTLFALAPSYIFIHGTSAPPSAREHRPPVTYVGGPVPVSPGPAVWDPLPDVSGSAGYA